ncbi:MAG: VCBS repeat-containing protein [Bacteroidales bacterium]|nr:VCBS repeat-containing protein [Bacteroidales bacterium]
MFVEKKYKEIMESGRMDKNDLITSVLNQMPERKKINYFFRNNGDLSFEKKNGDWADNIPTCSNGSAYADFDNDGDMDIIVNNSESPSFIYKNKARENGLGN